MLGPLWDYIWAVLKISKLEMVTLSFTSSLPTLPPAFWVQTFSSLAFTCRLQWQSYYLLHRHDRQRKSYPPTKGQTLLPIFFLLLLTYFAWKGNCGHAKSYGTVVNKINLLLTLFLICPLSSLLTSICSIAGYCLQDCQPWMGVFSSSWLSLPISKQYFPIVVSF